MIRPGDTPRTVVVVCCAVAVAATVWAVLSLTNWGINEVWPPDLLAGLALIGSGTFITLRTDRRLSGVTLIAGGLLWFGANVATTGGPAAGLAAQLTYVHRGLVVAAAYVLIRQRAVAAASILVVVATLVPSWASSPRWVLGWSALALIGGFALLSSTDSRTRWWPLAPVAAVSLTCSSLAAQQLLAPSAGVGTAAATWYAVGFTGAGILVVISARATAPHHVSVTDAVLALSRGTANATAQLARALRDESLDVAFAADRGWVDDEGRPRARVAERAGRARLSIRMGDQIVAEIGCRSEIARSEPVLTAFAAAARLAARNARLRASLRTQADDLEASRRRLVVVDSHERLLLRSRLEDGVAPELRSIRERLDAAPDGDTTLGQALSRCRTALKEVETEVATLAAGLGPTPAMDQGFDTALRELLTRSPVAAVVRAPRLDVPNDVARAAYFVVTESLTNVVRHAPAAMVTVTAGMESEGLIVTVRDNGPGGAVESRGTGLQGLRDRVAAEGGTLTVVSEPGDGTTVSAWLPLGREVPQASPIRAHRTA